LRFKGLTVEELENIDSIELQAINRALALERQEQASFYFAQSDYDLLINANPTNSKGKPNTGKINQYRNQAKQLRESFTLTENNKKGITKEVIEEDRKQYSGLSYKEFIQTLKQNGSKEKE